MDLSKLFNQVATEAKKSPAKAAVLGGLCLVALYFWAPLVWGWVSPEDDGSSADEEAVSVFDAPTAPTANAAFPAAAIAAKVDWQALGLWQRTDPRMQPAKPLPDARDPFSAVKLAVAPTAATSTPDPTEPAATSRNFEQWGLTLTSTWAGTRGRQATISGVTLPEGDELLLDAQGQPLRPRATSAGAVPNAAASAPVANQPAHRFRLVEVGARHVVLEAGAARYVLRLPHPAEETDRTLIQRLDQTTSPATPDL